MASCKKRIMKDYKGFIKEPICNCFVKMSEDDITCWDAFIILDMDGKRCPLHMAIRFPDDYPAAAPSAGFSCSDFGYRDGAVYVQQDRENYFYGKLIICLDILGNFAQVHGEWAHTANSGWSPAYTISSLLCNVYVTLTEGISGLPKRSKEVLYEECMQFISTYDTTQLSPSFDIRTMSVIQNPADSHESEKEGSAIIAPFHDDLCKYLSSTIDHYKVMLKNHGEPPAGKLVEVISTISDRVGAMLLWNHAEENVIDMVKSCLEEAGWEVQVRAPKDDAELSLRRLLQTLSSLEAKLSVANTMNPSAVFLPDDSIRCWYSSDHYSNTILGVGIALVRGRAHTTLSTDGELLSISAFEDGLRQTPTKTVFEYFLPVWITSSHSVGSMKSCGMDWEVEVVKGVILIGNAIRNIGESKIETGKGIDINVLENSKIFASFVLRIYADIINSMVVKIMQPESDMRASERIFRYLMDCWRSLYWFKNRFPCVKNAMIKRVNSFTYNSDERNKKVEPNIGCLLAIRAAVTVAEVPLVEFFHAYIEESFLRGVMWWKKNSVREEARAVFEATKVSRRLFLFQSLFLTHSITDDLEGCAELADATECKLSGRLDDLLDRFKFEVEEEENRIHSHISGAELYTNFFDACGCPYPLATKDINSWISTHAQKAAITDGYFFSNSSNGKGGGGRGQGGMKGKGYGGWGYGGGGGKGRNNRR